MPMINLVKRMNCLIPFSIALIHGPLAAQGTEGGLPTCDNPAILGTTHELVTAMVGDFPVDIGSFHFDQVKEVSMNGVIRRCEYPFRVFTGDLGKITYIIRASGNEQGYTVQLVNSDPQG
ncbi:hypothetical protein LCGC14_0001580 [marine sediment metagenome]|uniref:PLAT domain-containing protein n=2 Tax=root TaxID=1 RepID=A0A0F9W717_9ZZZZ